MCNHHVYERLVGRLCHAWHARPGRLRCVEGVSGGKPQCGMIQRLLACMQCHVH